MKTKYIPMKKKLIISLLVLIAAIQLIPVNKNDGAADTPTDITHYVHVPQHVLHSLKKSCYDCHSNHTVYPWYAKINPVGWWLNYHVNEGKAELNFQMYPPMTKIRHLSSSYGIPEMIVVGIINTNRNRDLTPTHDASIFETSNVGGEWFSSFLEKELLPYINAHYTTAPYRLLIGYSLGGLLVVNTLLKYAYLFNSYVAIDPSLWWDNRQLLNQSADMLSHKQLKGKTLYLAIANSLPAGMSDTAQAKKIQAEPLLAFGHPSSLKTNLSTQQTKPCGGKVLIMPMNFMGLFL